MNSETDDLSARIRLCAQKVGSGDELSRRSGIPRRTLENYLSGRSEPKASAISAIAIAADVSTDWLITGLEPPEGGPEKSEEDESFRARLGVLVGDQKPFEWAKAAGIPSSTWNRAWNEGSVPKAQHLRRIAAYGGVTLDWLITGTGPMRRGEAAEAAPVAPAAPAGRAPLDADLLGLVIEGVHTTYRDENARIDQRNAARLAARIYDDVLIACEGDDDPGARKAALRMALQQLRRDLRAHPDETQGKQRA